MATSALSRSGLVNNGAGSATELFLKKFAGEVLTTFETESVFKPLHMVRTIENGKSASFPITGTASTAYHTPGQNILSDGSYLSAIGHNERVINIDNLLLSSTFIAKIDEAMNHYDVRSIYTEEIGRALAKKFDKTIAQVIHLASAASAVAPGKAGAGSVTITSTTLGVVNDGVNLAKGIYDAVIILDNNDVPDDGNRFCVLNPDNYAKLVYYLGNPDKPNSKANYTSNSVIEIAGVKVYKSNNLPIGTISADAGANNTYNGVFTATASTKNLGYVFHKNAVGTLKLLDLAVESEYRIDHQGTLIVSKYAMGHGILRPECAVRLV
ncbi:MAG: capsid protein [Proteobacteria bacterium]|nr:capsid protein [Pseudomonadota bacterium]NBP14034.1 capsid protein [bacterium]